MQELLFVREASLLKKVYLPLPFYLTNTRFLFWKNWPLHLWYAYFFLTAMPSSTRWHCDILRLAFNSCLFVSKRVKWNSQEHLATWLPTPMNYWTKPTWPISWHLMVKFIEQQVDNLHMWFRAPRVHLNYNNLHKMSCGVFFFFFFQLEIFTFKFHSQK